MAAAPPCWFAGSFVTVPPAMRSQVPLGTEIHASGSRSALVVPAQALLLVPQSFLPALTMPAHFSVSSLAACAVFAAIARVTAIRLARLPARRGLDAFMGNLLKGLRGRCRSDKVSFGFGI